MAGIYLHIPFCRKACHYCNFHFSTNLTYIDRMIEAMLLETKQAANRPIVNQIDSIYFGGGTPSVLEPSNIRRFLVLINQRYDINSDAEITLEVNPEDITLKYCEEIVMAGVNRVSMGIQSFFDHDLSFMNRAHNADQGRMAIEHIRAVGIESLCVDLMFGLVDSDMDQWKANLEQIVSYAPEHISCYNLTIEEQTAFHKWQEQGKIQSLKENIQFDQFMLGHDLLSAGGYDHYEISNFCKPGLHSRHNTNYWAHGDYLGIGPGAHSYFDGVRYWNCSNNMQYIKHMEESSLKQEKEELSEADVYNETIMLGLRQAKGVAKSRINSFSTDIVNHFYKLTNEMTSKGVVLDIADSVRITTQNWYLSDHISSKLFFD